MNYIAKTDRTISIRLNGNPVNITIIQVYGPTADVEEEKLHSFYNNVQEEIDGTPKQDLLMITSDWNAKMGNTEELRIFGKYDLGTQNEAGE